MSFTHKIETYWKKISTALLQEAQSDEDMVLNLHAEDSEFVRFNACKIRQNTSIAQVNLTVELKKGLKKTTHQWTLSGNFEADFQKLKPEIQVMRHELVQLPDDPHIPPTQNHGTSHAHHEFEAVSHESLLKVLEKHQSSMDLAGLFCQGPVIKANANSKGQNHWFSTGSFFFDYSLYNGPTAVKSGLSGSKWNEQKLEIQLQDAKNRLALLQKPKRKMSPGTYRAYLAPDAVQEILSTCSWGGLSENSFRQGQNGFQKAARGEEKLSPLFTLKENFQLGLTPRFNELGEAMPEEIRLFDKGTFRQFMTSTSTANEYKIESNFAPQAEMPRSLEIEPGSLKESEVLRELGTGLYLSNLHYLNWSDRNSGRITGMTRYACFYVEKGEIVAPIEDLRFDDSVLSLFGSHLVGLTETQEIIPATGTYYSRMLSGMKVPGILVDAFQVRF